MKAQPLNLVGGKYVSCEASDATHLRLRFPVNFSPLKERIIPIQTSGKREDTPNWTWNGSVEAPTLRPSVLTRWQGGNGTDIVCHSWVSDGSVQFLGDCTHNLAGQIWPLLEI